MMVVRLDADVTERGLVAQFGLLIYEVAIRDDNLRETISRVILLNEFLHFLDVHSRVVC